MFRHLQIYDPRERVLVGLADAGLTVAAGVVHLVPARRAAGPARRILLLRLERIGDLLMSAPAIAAVRQFAPDAAIDLVVGSWNASIARLIPGIDRVETLDAAWLARGRGGLGLRAMLAHAWRWRARDYDLAINFEGDIRSHLLLALSGAPRRAGFTMAGGGPLLTEPFAFDPGQHTTANAWRLVRGVFGRDDPDDRDAPRGEPQRASRSWHEAPEGGVLAGGETASPTRQQSSPILVVQPANYPAATQTWPHTPSGADAGWSASSALKGLGGGDAPFRLAVPALARERASALLGREARVIGLHASGGRQIKQWVPARFAEAAARVARECEATLVLTGSPGDRAIVDDVRAALPADIPTIDLTGELDLSILAAVLERCLLFITGDTGPMHLAAAVGTPIVAVFGPSQPARYAPLSTRHRVVRIDLPCAPCNRIRLPPARCQGHTPDCLEGITPDAVVQAALDLRREVEDATRNGDNDGNGRDGSGRDEPLRDLSSSEVEGDEPRGRSGVTTTGTIGGDLSDRNARGGR